MRRLKRLQTTLGRMQDSVVQTQLFRDAGDELHRHGASPETLLAIGSLTARIDTKSDDARADFVRSFARFDRGSIRSARDQMFVPTTGDAPPATPA